MSLPHLFVGLLVSSLCGACFHLIIGGGAGHFLLDLIAAWLGFWAGHLLADVIGRSFADLGPIHLGPALVVCVVALALAHWLSLLTPFNQKSA
jgi:hypothetical protein